MSLLKIIRTNLIYSKFKFNFGYQPFHTTTSSLNLLKNKVELKTKNEEKKDSKLELEKESKLEVKKEEETELCKLLKSIIKATGPIPFHEYMRLCNTSPYQGYYSTKNQVFGKSGDFVTSPEISQCFGETLAIFYISEWERCGKPDKIRIIELGPGKGTLMNDLLRTWRSFPDFYNNIINIDLIEASPNLAKIQKDLLIPNMKVINDDDDSNNNKEVLIDNPESNIIDKNGKVFKWRSALDIESQDENYWSAIIAHEFFDALPIHLFKKVKSEWREVVVDLETDQQSELNLNLYSDTQQSSNLTLLNTLPKQDILNKTGLELCPLAKDYIIKINQILNNKRGGIGLIIDYGHWEPKDDTIRGIRNHKFVHPTSQPGKTDLSYDVNFKYLTQSLDENINYFGPITQSKFLINYGIQIRFSELFNQFKDNILKSDLNNQIKFKNLNTKALDLEKDFNRLTNQNEMGDIYKVMVLTKFNKPIGF